MRACYRAYLSGHAMNAILRALNGDDSSTAYPALREALAGLKGPQKPWTRTRLKYLLINPKYCGFVAYVSEPARPGMKRRQRSCIVAERIVRDDDGQPVHGDWEPIITEAEWYAAREKALARQRGQQPNWRKHIGSGIYRCGVCGGPMYASSGSYRCKKPGHACRLQKPIDDLVLRTVRERLARGDLAQLLPHDDSGRLAEIETELADCEAKLKRYQEDYRAGFIGGAHFKEWSDEETERRDRLIAERDGLTTDPTGGILTADDPVAAFDAIAEDPVRVGNIIDYLMTVTIDKKPVATKGRGRKFNYTGIHIKWKEH